MDVELIQQIWFAYASIVTTASVIVKLTPTKKDDLIVQKVDTFGKKVKKF